jgi:hypothetical protein
LKRRITRAGIGTDVAGEVVFDDHTMVGRAFAIVEAVAAHGPPVSLAELAYMTGIPKPTNSSHR